MSNDDKQEPNVEQNLDRLREDIRERFKKAISKSKVSQGEAEKDFSKATNENPEACVEFEAKDVHLLPVVLEELFNYFLVYWENDPAIYHLIYSGGGKEFVRLRAIHESDHIQALIKEGKKFEGFGIFFCKKPNGNFDGIPYIRHEKLDPETKKSIVSAPREFLSPGDINILAKLEIK